MPTATWPVHGNLPEIVPPIGVEQRWSRRRGCWTTRHEGGFRRELFTCERIPRTLAKPYVEANHYSGRFVVPKYCFGMYVADDTEQEGRALVGVVVFGIPVNGNVLTKVLPDEEKYVTSLELSRLVVEGDPLTPGAPGGRAPANSETWFLGQAFNALAELGVRGIVAHADPVPRRGDTGIVLPGHWGTVYQAKTAAYTGRTDPRDLTVLRDGTVFPDRDKTKIRQQERGHEYAEKHLISHGASPRIGSDPKTWLLRALEDVGARRLRHGGVHRFVLATKAAKQRPLRIALPLLPYPKPTGPGHFAGGPGLWQPALPL